MEKQVFLDRVRQRLLQNGISESTVERQILRLDRYIDEEGGDNTEAMLEGEDPILLAEEICTALRRNAARRAAAEAAAAVEAEPEPAPAPIQARPSPTATMVPPRDINARTREIDIVHPERGADIVELPDSMPLDGPGADFSADGADNIYLPPMEPEPEPRRHRRSGGLEVDHLRSRAMEYEGETGGPLFWVTFILALPFAAAIGLAVLALFVAAFAALSALMVASIAALAAVAAAGTAFTLVALVYGIVQALSVLPVGLYEIGIGVTAGAAVLFVSILLYNFAVRLIPFTMKQLARFFGFTVRNLKALFIYLKGACAKL